MSEACAVAVLTDTWISTNQVNIKFIINDHINNRLIFIFDYTCSSGFGSNSSLLVDYLIIFF
jgi:hypothetical protein